MMLFYGIYFWCTHSLFSVQLVYIPTSILFVKNLNILVIATILSVLPLINISIAALPGCIDIFFIQGKSYFVVFIFFVLHFLPPYFVDPIIYGEIKRFLFQFLLFF